MTITLRLFALVAVFTQTHAGQGRIECVAGCGTSPLPGPIREAKLTQPFGVDFGSDGEWYIVEWRGGDKVIRVDAQGRAVRFAGTGKAGDSGDGGPALNAELNEPHSLYLHRGSLFIADTSNHRVRRVDLKSGLITTVAGTGQAGFSGDGGPAVQAQFNQTYDLIPLENRLFVADLGNRRVRVIDLSSGLVKTFAGTGADGEPADGSPAADSPLTDPRAVAADSSGNLYILSRRGNALYLVNQEGRIRTLIRPGQFTPDLKGPKHLTLDRQGNVLIADTENHLIRRYDVRTKELITLVGTGRAGARLETADPLATELDRPHGVTVHPSGAIYISDSENHRVLKWTP